MANVGPCSGFERKVQSFLNQRKLIALLQVIVGSVVARGPATDLAPSAFIELELAVQLFGKAEMHPVVKVGLVSITGFKVLWD